MFIPFSGSPSAVYGLPCGSRPSDDTKAQVPKSEAPRPGGQLRAWKLRCAGPAGEGGPGSSRRLRAETAGPRGRCASPIRRQKRTLAEEGGDVTACLFLRADNKVSKFERGGKNPRPLGRPRVAACSPGGARVALRARRRGGAGRAGMGVTVEVHQVYKYPFEQVVASFLRKVPARLRSGAPVLPRLRRRQLSAPRRLFCRCPSPSRPRVPIPPGRSSPLLSSVSPVSPLVLPPLPTPESAPAVSPAAAVLPPRGAGRRWRFPRRLPPPAAGRLRARPHVHSAAAEGEAPGEGEGKPRFRGPVDVG